MTDHRYSAYGLLIRSDVELSVLDPVDGADADTDVVIREGDVPRIPKSDDDDSVRYRADPGTFRLTVDGIASFLIEQGERIRYDPAAPTVLETDIFESMILNQTLGLLLHQRGYLVLHASAVSIDGRAAVFIGPRGAGKSTTAAACHAAGHRVIADDVVGITFEDGDPVVVPGIPRLRLLSDAVDFIGVDTELDVDPVSDKHQLLSDGIATSTPLKRIFVLGTDETISVTSPPGRESFLALLKNSYATAVIPDSDTVSRHFQACAAVLEHPVCKRLDRPKDPEELQRLIDTIVEEVLD